MPKAPKAESTGQICPTFPPLGVKTKKTQRRNGNSNFQKTTAKLVKHLILSLSARDPRVRSIHLISKLANNLLNKQPNEKEQKWIAQSQTLINNFCSTDESYTGIFSIGDVEEVEMDSMISNQEISNSADSTNSETHVTDAVSPVSREIKDTSSEPKKSKPSKKKKERVTQELKRAEEREASVETEEELQSSKVFKMPVLPGEDRSMEDSDGSYHEE